MIEDIRKLYNKTKFDFSKKGNIIENYKMPFNWVKIFFKAYPRMNRVKLDFPVDDGEFCNLLNSRQSVRDFENSPISIDSLNKILFYSLGIKNLGEPWENTKRFYPSAGGRYPIEAYILNNNIKELDKGLYHYNVKENSLEQLLSKNLSFESSQIFDEAYKNNPSFIILNGVLSRTEVKYGANSYRFALLEAGHIGQNISLLAEKEKLGCCALGGFDNNKLSKLIDITQEDEILLYAFSLGKPLI